MASAIRALKISTCCASSPSTMTRASGSVPEKRTNTRPVPAKAVFHVLNLTRHRRNIGQRFLFAHPHIHQLLRIHAEIRRQFVQPGPGGARRLDGAQGSQRFRRRWWQTPAESRGPTVRHRATPRADHLFEHVFIAHGHPHHADTGASPALFRAPDWTSPWQPQCPLANGPKLSWRAPAPATWNRRRLPCRCSPP